MTTKHAWHAMPVRDIAAELGARKAGLTGAEAQTRLQRYGPNRLPGKPPPGWWQIGLRQFQSPLIYILALAAIVSVAIGHGEDAGFIVVVLVLNGLIGGYQEWKAERSSQALQHLLQIHASVLRDDEVIEVDAESVVPGDVVWLESGARVPADLRLFQAQGLEIDESLLTGESMPVPKDPAWPGDESAPLADRRNMAYAGSTINRGRARGMVVATGAHTVVGQLALDVLSARGGRPPLLERMERFARVVAFAVLGAATTMGLLGVLLRGYGVGDMFLFGVALAVSAIPEGLPVALTVALAVATTRMSRRGVIVRRLAAVEGLGSCTLIASDKTGTLTCNELTVTTIHLASGRELTVSGKGYAPEGEVSSDASSVEPRSDPHLDALARAVALCNEGDLHRRGDDWVWRGDPTDVALLSLAHKLGWTREAAISRHPQVNEIPFEPERRFAATFHQVEDRPWVFVKGAPERVLGMCDVAPGEHDRLLTLAESMAERGLRVLALAEGPAAAELEPMDTPEEPTGLALLGFVGMIDPLRPGAREAVQSCRDAGITVCMITGDHPVTALSIARELELAQRPEQVITGREIAGFTSEELRDAVRDIRVFARTTPRQKLDLVEAARQLGHFVAVTGDGVNDAPALRQANIGVAMGRSGTDVAREAAELVITDDNFATIVAGIEEGRVAYDNVRKVVYLLVSTGAAEVLLLGLAVLTGWPHTTEAGSILPLLPVQILWLNLVTNGIQDVALAFEPSEGEVLRRPPRPPGQRVFDRLMVERTLVAAVVMAGVGFTAFNWMVSVAGWSESQSRNALLLLMVLFQNLHIGNCRSETQSAFRLSPLTSPILLAGTLVAFSIHMLAMQVPLAQRILGVEPVGLRTIAALFALAVTIVIAMELHKWRWRARRRGRST
ncbi:MAG TPA: HAD-IC family P-type ATPase [Thermoanaerobaculia bacterium]|nr:HAD-IC family P-type ATPase [Thermoanaerobaculia bacterium]